MADWDQNSPRLSQNLKSVLRSLRRQARARAPIDVQLAKSWHAQIMNGLNVPDPQYVGAFRGEPGLESIGVRIGTHEGSPPAQVSAELQSFQAHLVAAIEYLDEVLPPGTVPDTNTLTAILDVCAFAHAEWVRIHPFANGNGRTARLWANLIAMRYGLPPFVRLRPRPAGDAYAQAGADAMTGKWENTADVFRDMLDDFLEGN